VAVKTEPSATLGFMVVKKPADLKKLIAPPLTFTKQSTHNPTVGNHREHLRTPRFQLSQLSDCDY
jgi:hypothetical protein